jgi:hypothetical protein
MLDRNLDHGFQIDADPGLLPYRPDPDENLAKWGVQ